VLAVAGILVLGGTPCAGAQECDDDRSCTDPDVCVEGECGGAWIACADDGDVCTREECVEEEGGCVSTPIVCDDLNPCTTDSCDPVTGCAFTAREEAAPCEDLFQCTSNDRCRTAFPFIMMCDVPGVPVNPCIKPFGNACENHQCVCSSDADCQTVIRPDLKRKCLEGRCVRTCTGPGDCPLSQFGDAQVCVEGECLVQLPSPVCLGDLPTEDGGPCDDQLRCTANDRCQIYEVEVEGIPTPIPAPICLGDPRTGSCDDELPCTQGDTCQSYPIEIEGLPAPIELPICVGTPLENGTACEPAVDDDIPCTVPQCMGESMEIEGVTLGVSLCVELPDCPQDENLCTFELCDPNSGIVACTSFEICGGPCVTGCNPGTGECIKASDGTTCDDENVCTVNDRCAAGECAGVPPGEIPTPTPTGSVANTPTPSATFTCAPTGTPYCSDECLPCPTIRPDCPAVACGACIENPDCGTNEVCVPDESGPISGCCSCATVTPTKSGTEGPVDTPTATQTQDEATVTESPGELCPGDCNGSGTVTVDELVKGVNIALGVAEVGTCSAFDATGDLAVTIDELVKAVRAALEGCPAVMDA